MHPNVLLDTLITSWCEEWGVPSLPTRITVLVSPRVRISLGRCRPADGEIRIASFLLASRAALLHEVLCHEVAHAAVFELHGRSVRPHGREWRDLMRAAGFEPRVRIPTGDVERLVGSAQQRRGVWEHRCPVCQMSRVAGRPVREWRCASCLRVGLEGGLIITRRAEPLSQVRT